MGRGRPGRAEPTAPVRRRWDRASAAGWRAGARRLPTHRPAGHLRLPRLRVDGDLLMPDQPSCPSCGETPMFRSVVHECCERLEAALALEEQPWDRADPDTQAA